MIMQKAASKPREICLHVHFDDDVVCHEVPHHSSFTTLEVNSTWYQASDYERIDDENDSILDAMMMDETYSCNKSNLYSTRGLECLLPERANIREEARQALWDAVIDEQLYQWRTGIENPEAIAKAYRETSIQHYERIAHLKGMMDEKQAMKVHSENLRHETNKKRLRNKNRNKNGDKTKDGLKRQASTMLTRRSIEKNEYWDNLKETALIDDPSSSKCQTSEWQSLLNKKQTERIQPSLFPSKLRHLKRDEQLRDVVGVRKRIIVWEY